MNHKLQESIAKALLQATGEPERTVEKKQITSILDTKLIREVDFLVAKFTELGAELPRSRNQLIETAIEEYVMEAKNALFKARLSTPEEVAQAVERIEDWEVIVVAGPEEEFHSLFLYERRWYPININHSKIKDVQYIAYYRMKEFQGISHYSKIKSIRRIDEASPKDVLEFMEREGKSLEDNYYECTFGEPIQLEHAIMRGDAVAIQKHKFTTLEKLLRATNLRQL